MAVSHQFASRITRVYRLALGLTALLLIIAQLILQSFLYELSFESREINLAGKMRMLSQRTVKIALFVEKYPNSSSYREQLQSTIEELEVVFSALQSGDTALRVRAVEDGPARQLFASAAPTLARVVEAARALSEADDPEQIARHTMTITTNDDGLLEAIAAIPARFDETGRRDVEVLQGVELGILAIALLVLLAEWRLLFTPISRLAAQSLRRFEEASTLRRLAALGELSGGIAHEINSPLAAVVISLQQLRRKLARGRVSDPSELLGGLDRAIDNSTRVADIVRSVQGLASPKLAKPRAKVLVSDLFTKAEAAVRENHSIFRQTVRRLPGAETIELFCVEEDIVQMLAAVIANAVEAVSGQSDGWVEIGAEVEGDLVRMTIRDSGNGVHPEDEHKIFDPFFTTKEIGEGMGLGLALSQRLALLHYGSLSYRRIKGHTAFVFELPQEPRAEVHQNVVKMEASVRHNEQSQDQVPELSAAAMMLYR